MLRTLDSKLSTGALTIDLEEYFQVSAFESIIARDEWPNYASRVQDATHKLLQMFADHEAQATFFCLGVVARDHPSLIKEIAEHGHEIASHGWGHARVHTLSERTFTDDIQKSKHLLEDITGVPVRGYRAPSFSVDLEKTPWVYDCLAKAGYTYSSSQHPITHDHYGHTNGARAPFFPSTSNVWEVPISTVRYFNKQLPCGGGGFFRLLPLAWFTHAFKRIEQEGLRVNFYLHPWEIDPGQPRISRLPLKTRIRHYIGLTRCEAKLSKLLKTRQWTRMDTAYADILETRTAP